MANFLFTSSYMATMFVFDFRWSMGVFHYLINLEIMTDENVGIDTQTKSVDGLIRKILMIE